ncbi:hypothetical protein V5F40_21815 [Xanthobacter sp. DSM 14520]|uniref:hypothetical protein n=1 Tax=Xanthobacter autotrophicus (strain ATCC BAA-1158 / Py2) TaxID=78245 RepID=UPI003728D27C
MLLGLKSEKSNAEGDPPAIQSAAGPLTSARAHVAQVLYGCLASASVVCFSALPAAAQTSTTDPAAPLDFLKTARSTASSSNLNTTSVSSFGGNIATIVAIAAGVVGLVLAAVSGKKLYDSVQNENSRENVGASVAGLAIGALLTIIGIIVGAVTNFATG